MHNEHSEALNPKVSILIAAYNVEQYLPKAMDSCVNQTYKNIEIIAVDDCSTDRTGEILEQYARQDEYSRVKVIHHEKNKSRLSVRKNAVAAATGDYIMFLDGDDYLDPMACEELLKAMEREKVDILEFETTFVDTEKVSEDHLRVMKNLCLTYAGRIEEGSNLVKAAFGEHKFGWMIWNKLWRAEVCKKGFGLIGDLRVFFYEDDLICFACYLMAKNYASVDKKLHYYRQGSGITAPGQKKYDRISALTGSYSVISEISRICNELGYSEYLKNEVDNIRSDLAQTATWNWYSETKDDPRKALDYFERFLTNWPAAELVSAIAAENSRCGYFLPDEIWRRICPASCFGVKTEKVRTIGIYCGCHDDDGKRIEAILSRVFKQAGYRVVLFFEEAGNGTACSLDIENDCVILPQSDLLSVGKCRDRMQAWRKGIEEYHVDLVIHDARTNGVIFEEMAVRCAGVSMIAYSDHLLTEERLNLTEKYDNLKRWTDELTVGKQWLEDHSAELEKYIADLLAGKQWLESHSAEQEKYIADLLAGKQWLEEHSAAQEREIERLIKANEDLQKKYDELAATNH